jgi:hypothetical protein
MAEGGKRAAWAGRGRGFEIRGYPAPAPGAIAPR